MKRRHLFVAGIGGTLASAARAAGLGAFDRRYLDGVRVDPNTHGVTLLLVIDRPLEDGLTKAAAQRKLRAYWNWVYTFKNLSKYFPEANLAVGVQVLITHPAAQNALGRSVLEQVVAYAKSLRFIPTLQQLPP